jgi:hypothetical protein
MMSRYWKTACRAALSAGVLAALLGGCVIATESHPRAAGASEGPGGAASCMRSADGSSVACGSRAITCEQSGDGRRVACGGQATYCLKSSAGNDVACGGRAIICDQSSDGRAVACGGSR